MSQLRYIVSLLTKSNREQTKKPMKRDVEDRRQGVTPVAREEHLLNPIASHASNGATLSTSGVFRLMPRNS